MSERFEGLSLPQLVELLHDLAVPPSISRVPETIGWQIIAAWAVAVAGLLAIHGFLRWRRNGYRREALASLRLIEERVGADAAALEELGDLLKRTAMTAYSRERVAPLYGGAWADFLKTSSGGDAAVSAAASQLSRIAYRPPADTAAVLNAARRWIRCHRD